MFKKTICIAVLAITLMTVSCQSGPKRFTRTWDNYVNQAYSENAWIHGALLQDVLPVYPFVGLVAAFGDAFYNFYYFWAIDAWDNKGTAYTYTQADGAEKAVSGCVD